MKYNVFPLDDRKAERANPDLAGRPAVVRGNTQLLFPGMRRIQENAVINTKNKNHSVTAEIEVPASGSARGVIIAQGGNMGGWSLYAHEGKLKYCYNFLGVRQFGVCASDPLPAGKHQARMEFAYDGGGLGKGALVTLFVDGKNSARTHRAHTCAVLLDGRDDGGRLRRGRAGLARLRRARESSSMGRSTGCKSILMPLPGYRSQDSAPKSDSRWQWRDNDWRTSFEQQLCNRRRLLTALAMFSFAAMRAAIERR
jgi:hypothetical protein